MRAFETGLVNLIVALEAFHLGEDRLQFLVHRKHQRPLAHCIQVEGFGFRLQFVGFGFRVSGLRFGFRI